MSNVNFDKIPGSFLHISDIIKKHQEKPIFEIKSEDYRTIEEYLSEQEKNNGVVIDLRLGAEVYRAQDEKVTRLSEGLSTIQINPGDFALLTTFETLHIPKDLIAFISMRFRKSLEGLINISGFHVDPGYNGLLIFSVYNSGPRPVVLEYKEAVFMIIFSKISKSLTHEPTKEFQEIHGLKPKYWSGLTGQPVSLRNLDQRIKNLELWNKVTWGLVIALAGTIITGIVAIFTAFFKG